MRKSWINYFRVAHPVSINGVEVYHKQALIKAYPDEDWNHTYYIDDGIQLKGYNCIEAVKALVGKQSTKKKTKQINLRLTAEEYQILKEKSEAKGLTLTNYMIQSCLTTGDIK